MPQSIWVNLAYRGALLLELELNLLVQNVDETTLTSYPHTRLTTVWVSWLWSWQMHAWCQAVFPSFLDHRECFLMWCGIDISFNQVSLTTTVSKVYKFIRLAMILYVIILGFPAMKLCQCPLTFVIYHFPSIELLSAYFGQEPKLASKSHYCLPIREHLQHLDVSNCLNHLL